MYVKPPYPSHMIFVVRIHIFNSIPNPTMVSGKYIKLYANITITNPKQNINILWYLIESSFENSFLITD